MNIKDLEAFELKYNFKYPSLYKQLCNDGMLTTGEFGPNWYKENYPKFRENPLFLLWSNDVELLEEFGIEEYISDMEDPDMWHLKSGIKLIPFAQNHGGDLYCFYYNEQQGDNIPILLLTHDGEYSTILSKNLQDFIFRVLLETASALPFSISKAMTEKQNEEKQQQAIHDNKAMVNNHKQYLTPDQAKVIDEIYQREAIKHTWVDEWNTKCTSLGYLANNEINIILKQEIDFPLLDKKVSLLA